MLFFLEREVPAFLRLLMLPTSGFLAIMTASVRNISECVNFAVVWATFKDYKYFWTAVFWGKSQEKKMHRFILALSCILTMLAAPISAQDFQKGLEAAQSGDFATALKEWKPLAEGGDSVAQYNLGVMYKNGW